MIKKKKVIGKFFLLAILLVGLCGCEKKQISSIPSGPVDENKKKEEQIHLSVLYSGEDVNWVATIEELSENFMRENPSIVLDMLPPEAGIYTETLKIKEATDEFPDIFEIQDPYMFAKANKLGEIPESVSNLVDNPVKIDDKVYALPLYTTTYGIVYNQVLFKKYQIEEPKTYAEFLQVCQKFKEYGITPLAIGGSKVDNLSYWMNYFFQIDVISHTPDWQEKRNRDEVSFQDADMQQMMRDYQGLMTSSYILEDAINMKDNQLVSQFVDSNVAMIYTGPWMFSQIIDAYPLATESDKNPLGEDLEEDQVKCRLGWFFMPDKEGKPVALNESGTEWAISKACQENEEKEKAATAFFAYFYQTVNYRKVLQSMYAIPTTQEAVLYPTAGVQQRLLVDYRYADKKNSYLGNNETPEGFDRALYKILNSVATGVMSVETATEKLDVYWDEAKEQ